MYKLKLAVFFITFFSYFVLSAQDTKVNKTIRTLLSDLPVVYQNEVRGGYHTAANLLSPSGDIATSRKEVGMLAWDVASAMHYQWDGSGWHAVFLLKNWEPGSAKSGQLYLKDSQIYRSLQDNTVTGTTDPATDALNWVLVGTKVIDDLTSTSTVEALSANQGRVLNSKIEDNIAAIEDNANAIALRPLGSTKGELQYWDGNSWVLIEPTSSNGSDLKMIDLVPVWVGVPGAPTGVTAVAGNGEATVSFMAPASDGGSAIISYTAASYPDGISATINQSDGGSITIPGLSNGTSYFFTVTATNMAGTSPVSLASNAVTPEGVSSSPIDVLSPTGKIWIDRNLGASRVATSSKDEDAYGDLYQWGRAADGHQLRTSATTATTSTNDTPGHSDFITISASPNDWRITQNDMLWQGVSGINNPCPSGYRLPTDSEWNAEIASWSSANAAGAFASPLKLPMAGSRIGGSGTLYSVGSSGYYWSSAVDGTSVRYLDFFSSRATMSSFYRANGLSVRCLKD